MRNSSGASLVELLVVVLVMSFVAVAAFGMLTTTMASQLKLQNKADSLDSARKTIERMGRTVRMGRQITNDPDFGNVGPTNLIVAVPKFSDTGFPYEVANVPAMEVHQFQVIADPNNAGEFMIQWNKKAGPAVPASALPQKAMLNTNQGPQVLVSGIVAPANGNCFRYINRTNPGAAPEPTPTGTMTDYTGVEIQLEAIEHRNSTRDTLSGNWRKPAVLAYKSEVFMRNNTFQSPQP